MNKYRFYITHNSITTEVYPLYSGLQFKWKKEGYRFSEECSTVFTFNGSNFNTIYSIETGELRCEAITFEIKKSCDKGATYSSRWIGSFSLNDGEFNINRCTFKVKASVVDRYTCLNSNKNKKINVLQETSVISITSEHKNYPYTVEYSFYDNTDPAPDNSTLIGSLGLGTTLLYATEVATTNDIDGQHVPPDSNSSWVMTGSSPTTSTWKKPLNIINLDEVQYSYQYYSYSVWPPDQASFLYYYPQSPASVDRLVHFISPALAGSTPGVAPPTIAGHYAYVHIANNSSFSVYDDFWAALPHSYDPTPTYTRFRTLYSIFDYVINKICPDITGVVSDFFEWNPIGDAPGYVAGENYVTELDNIVDKLAISAKSDVLNPAASQYATVGEISFNDLVNDICTLFHLDWFIDDSGNFRIEHISYFASVLGYNTTEEPNVILNQSNQVYSYSKEKMPNRESFSCSDAQGIDFVGRNIIYSGACVEDDSSNIGAGEKQYSVPNFMTDLNFIDDYPASINKTGFVLVAYGPGNIVVQEIGKMSGYLVNNGHLSWANLHYNYHRHGRVLLEGNMNGIDQTFFTAIENKVQKNVKLKNCCGVNFDPTGKLVQTELGIGVIESAEEENEIIKMNINY